MTRPSAPPPASPSLVAAIRARVQVMRGRAGYRAGRGAVKSGRPRVLFGWDEEDT